MNEVKRMSKNLSARSPAMDVVRSFALLFVISVHFLLNSGYYSVAVDGPVMFVMTVLRALFIICVPLFMMLSGYLMINKQPNKKYYAKIGYVLVIYLLATLCCTAYKVFMLKETVTVGNVIRGLLNYTGAQYAWYVEMYIGLFLLVPFLNVLYNNLKSQKEKQLLLAVLLFLTALPKVLNVFVPDLAWFRNPTSSKDYWHLVPDFWVVLYPITYYFLGAYIKEYKIPLRPRTLALLSVLLMVANGAYLYYRCHGVAFIWGGWQDYGSLFIVAQSVLFFAFFDNLNYDKFPRFLAKGVQHVSKLSFGAYLVSWVFDQHFYKMLKEAHPDILSRMKYLPIIVFCVLTCSLLASFVMEKIYEFLVFLKNKLFPQKEKSSP